MSRNEYFDVAEKELGREDIEGIYRHCYNQSVNNNDKENADWFGSRVLKAINQRWINRYVVPTGMLVK